MMDIEQYLRDNKPEMPEEGQFLVETNARLCNVEGVKKCVDEDRHRGRKALIIALVTGIVLGCLTSMLVALYPLPSIEINHSVIAKAVATLQEWKEFLIALIAGCSIALGVILITRESSVL